MTEYEGSLKTHLTAGPCGGGEGMVKDYGVSETSIPGFCWIREFGRICWGALIEAEILGGIQFNLKVGEVELEYANCIVLPD